MKNIAEAIVIRRVVLNAVTPEATPAVKPLWKPDYSQCSFLRRWWNQFFDWLENFMNGVHDIHNKPLTDELSEGYKEIADHAAEMRKKYPESYAAADKELRKRYFHLD